MTGGANLLNGDAALGKAGSLLEDARAAGDLVARLVAPRAPLPAGNTPQAVMFLGISLVRAGLSGHPATRGINGPRSGPS